MGRFAAWGRRFRAADTALGWAERIYLLYMLGLSTIVGSVFGVITWIVQNFVYGILAFFGTWTLVTALQAFRVIRRSAPTGEPNAPPQSEEATAQHPAPPTAELAEIARLKAENQELKAKVSEQTRILHEQRRKRIEEWRYAIQNHEFGDYPRFASTVAYSQMKPDLRPEVIKMLEEPTTFHVGNEARGELAYEYTLLDEVARIERKWGLI